jgi:hypothetical protein
LPDPATPVTMMTICSHLDHPALSRSWLYLLRKASLQSEYDVDDFLERSDHRAQGGA